MSTYNGWTVQTMPSDPPAPASLEFQWNAITGATTNPFTGQQQIYDWQAHYAEASVSYASMTHTDGSAWAAFFKSLDGTACVFTFPSALCSLYPDEMTVDGTNPRYWRLKGNSIKWTIKPGQIYGVTFEIREAI
jgi:hypothetical protein